MTRGMRRHPPSSPRPAAETRTLPLSHVLQRSAFHFARESFVLLFWIGAWQLLVMTALPNEWWFALLCVATGVVGHTSVFLVGRDLGMQAVVGPGAATRSAT